MEFKPLPGVISKSGVTYEVAQDGTVRSISKHGIKKILKPNIIGMCKQINIAGEVRRIYNIVVDAGWSLIEWPSDTRDWEELSVISLLGYRYRIFEDSDIQSLDRYGNVKQLSLHKANSGYINVKLVDKSRLVHQLMGTVERWFPKPPEWDDTWSIHHKNNDPTNNHKDNLEWATLNTQNTKQRQLEQTRIVSCPVIGIALQDSYIKNGDLIEKGVFKKFDSMVDAARKITGGSNRTISACIAGKFKSHAGFIWKTPQSDDDLPGEVFSTIGKGCQSERFISTHGRMKYLFHHGYAMIKSSEDVLTARQKLETDTYPRVKINGKQVYFHRIVIELFVGDIPKGVVIDHVDDIKVNSRLGNLQILTKSENSLKQHLQSYVMSVASFVEKKHEKTHDTKKSAIEYIRSNGYPDASLEELETVLNTMKIENIPAVLYGRTWIPAHFESYVKKTN